MSPNLPELIARFVRDVIPDYADVRTAWGMCDTVTDRFIRYVAEHGIELKRYTFDANGKNAYSNDQPNPAPEIYITRGTDGNTLYNEAGWCMCDWHCVVDAGECLIDFTARQYQTADHRMEFPTIIPMNRAMAAHA